VTDQNPPDPTQQPQMAPGWYPDPMQAGHQREWDGQQWVGPSVPAAGQKKKGGFPKWAIAVIACLGLGIVAVIGGALAGSGDDEDGQDVSAEETTTTAEESTTEAAEEEATTEAPEETTTEAPEETTTTTTTAPTTTTTEPAAEPIVQSGQGVGLTPPFEVPAGDYAVHYNFGQDCYYSGDLRPTDGDEFDGFDIGSGQGPIEGDTYAYDVPGGEYYIDLNTGPAPNCPWEITLTLQD